MSPVRTRVVDEFPRSGRDEVSRFWADPRLRSFAAPISEGQQLATIPI